MPRAKKSLPPRQTGAKSATAPDETPVVPPPVTPTAASTATDVKTKVISKTSLAIATAFLGAAAIAAGLVSLPSTDPMYGYNNNTCWDSDYTVKNDAGMPLYRYSFVNFGTKGAAYGIKTGTSEYVAGTDQCWNDKRLLEFFCDIKNNKVTWNSYNCAAGTSCVDGACVSAGKPDLTVVDISVMPDDNNPGKKIVAVNVKNIGNAEALSFGAVLYLKGVGINNTVIVAPEEPGYDDSFPSWGSAGVGPGQMVTYAISGISLPTTVTLASAVDPGNLVKESNETNNYLEKSFVESGKMIFEVGSVSNKLNNGFQKLGVVELSALNEPITLNSLKFTVWPASGQSTTTISNLRLVDSLENIIAGPVSLVADPTQAGYYYAIFDNINFVLPEYDIKLVDWVKQITLKGDITGVYTGSYIGVRINPSKDIVGTGMDSGLKISPTIDKLVAVSDKTY